MVQRSALLVLDQSLQPPQAALQLVARILNLIGVVNDPRGHEHDQLGPLLSVRSRSERRAQNRNAVQVRYARGAEGIRLGDDSTDCDSIAILYGDLRLYMTFREGRRLNLTDGSRL